MTQQCRQNIHLCEGGMFKESRDRHLKIYAHPYRRPLLNFVKSLPPAPLNFVCKFLGAGSRDMRKF